MPSRAQAKPVVRPFAYSRHHSILLNLHWPNQHHKTSAVIIVVHEQAGRTVRGRNKPTPHELIA